MLTPEEREKKDQLAKECEQKAQEWLTIDDGLSERARKQLETEAKLSGMRYELFMQLHGLIRNLDKDKIDKLAEARSNFTSNDNTYFADIAGFSLYFETEREGEFGCDRKGGFVESKYDLGESGKLQSEVLAELSKALFPAAKIAKELQNVDYIARLSIHPFTLLNWI